MQSRLLNERESELEHLRGEIEIARKAEADLRIAMIEIDSRELAATQNHKAEKAKLQAALDRANGERMAARLRARQYAAAGRGTLRGRAGRNSPCRASASTTSPLEGRGEWHMAGCREEKIQDL